MYRCTDTFIRKLVGLTSDEVLNLAVAQRRPAKQGEPPVIRMLQISDLHPHLPRVDGGPVQDSHMKDELAHQFAASVRSMVDDWRRSFSPSMNAVAPDKPFDGLIASGDFADAYAWKDESKDDQAQSLRRDHELTAQALGNVLSTFVHGGNEPEKNRRVLLVPGNHDVLRCGSNAGIGDENTTAATMLDSYYDVLFKKFDATGSAFTGINIMPKPVDNFARYPNLMLMGDRDGLIAVFGLDSNHSTYGFLGTEDHGLVKLDQLNSLERSIEALQGKLENIPLYIIVVLHHHILPVETFSDFQQFLKLRPKPKPPGKAPKKADDVQPGTGTPQLVTFTGFGPNAIIGAAYHQESAAEAGGSDKQKAPPKDTGRGQPEKVLRSVTLDSPDIIRTLQRCRVNLVLHGHMHAADVQKVSYIPLAPQDTDVRSGTVERERQPIELSIIACPSGPAPYLRSDQRASPYEGGIVLTFDMTRASVQVDIISRSNHGADIKRSVTLPLVSAGRVDASELRLYRRMKSWLAGKTTPPESDAAEDRAFNVLPEQNLQSETFGKAVDEQWRRNGYVQICGGSKLPNLGNVAFPINLTEQNLQEKKYDFLVLLRKSGRRRYVLLNNHTPIRQSSFGNWNAPLFPAFSNVSSLLDCLMNDFLRLQNELGIQSGPRRSELNTAIADLKRAIGTLPSLKSEQKMKLIPISEEEFVKFSPTDGEPVRYKCRMCVIDWNALGDHGESLVRALDLLGTLEEPASTEETNSASFRWEPGKTQVRSGFFWFPYENWRQWPAVAARNSDVMEWFDAVLGRLGRQKDGDPAEWLFCGEKKRIDLSHYPVRSVKSVGTLYEELKNVPYDDPAHTGSNPYDGIEPQAVVVRAECDPPGGSEWGYPWGTRLLVFADSDAARDPDAPVADLGDPIGVLRPVQRFVTEAGLHRAKGIREAVKACAPEFDTAALQPGSYLEVVFEATGLIQILPPILESIPETEREGTGPENREFLIADGNHRVVWFAWWSRRPVRCVMLDTGRNGSASKPYYAYPLGSRDWFGTANNIRDAKPHFLDRYIPRNTPLKDPFTRSEDLEALEYRKYFRNFSKVFEKIGLQGGKS